jgi:dienelactone hydrolase
MSSCCPPGSIGIKQGVEGSASEITPDQIVVPKSLGQMVTYQDLEIYTSGNVGAKSAVVVLPEVFGIASGRLKNIADQLASQGYYAVLPKVQPGSPYVTEVWENDGYGRGLEWGFEPLAAWLTAELPWEKTQPRLAKVLEYVKSTGATKIGMIGFCWGSWAIFKAAAEWPDVIACGVNCHPSVRLEEVLFNQSQNELAEKINCPMALLAAGNDVPNTKAGGDFQKIFNRKPFGPDCLFQEFPEMEHGWVSRGDDKVPTVKRDVEKALEISYEFLKKHLSQ